MCPRLVFVISFIDELAHSEFWPKPNMYNKICGLLDELPQWL